MAGPPDSVQNATAYGEMLDALWQYDKAAPYLEQAIELSPVPDPALQIRLGKALDRAGQPQQATPHYERHLALSDPDDPPLEVRSQRAQTPARLRRWPEVIATLRPIVAEAPDRAADRGLLGMALTYTSESAEAREQFETAVEGLPGDAQSRDFLGMARAQAKQAVNAARTTNRPDLIAKIEARVALYEQGKPDRE